MKLLLSCIFLILATFYTPGECLKCYQCLNTTNVPVKTGSKMAIPYCNMTGTNFDASSNTHESAEAIYCMKTVVQVDSEIYTIRSPSTLDNCDAFVQQVFPVTFLKQATKDQISFCGICSSDLCNSGNSFTSLQMAFSTFTMLSFLYFIS